MSAHYKQERSRSGDTRAWSHMQFRLFIQCGTQMRGKCSPPPFIRKLLPYFSVVYQIHIFIGELTTHSNELHFFVIIKFFIGRNDLHFEHLARFFWGQWLEMLFTTLSLWKLDTSLLGENSTISLTYPWQHFNIQIKKKIILNHCLLWWIFNQELRIKKRSILQLFCSFNF